MTDGLKNEHREAIIAVIAGNDRVERAVLFGSRATGTNTATSDVDIALFGDRLTMTDQARLGAAVEEIPMAQSVDLILYDSVRDRTLLEHIRNDGVEWFDREHVPVVEATGEADIRRAALADIIDLTLSSVDKKTKPRERPVRLCNYMDVYRNTFITDQLAFMAATATDREVARCGLARGDVIITKDSEKHDDIGVPALVRHDIANLVCGYHLAILRPRPAHVVGDYLVYALKATPVQHQFHAYANGVTRFGLRKADIGLVEVPLPPLSEQRAIAHVLGTLDDKIELNRRMNETLEAMARALFRSWFVDFDPVRAKMEGRDTGLPADLADLFPDRLVDSELGFIPEGWRVTALGDLIELAYGKSLPHRKRKPGSVPVYGSNGQVGWHDERLIDGPGIIVGRKGNPGVVKWSQKPFFPIDTTFYVVPRDTRCGLFFLFHVLRTQDLPSIASDSAVPGMNRNLAYMNRAIVPPADVVEAFSTKTKTIAGRQDSLTSESGTLAALRDTLLPKLISGEIRVPDAERVAAPVT